MYKEPFRFFFKKKEGWRHWAADGTILAGAEQPQIIHLYLDIFDKYIDNSRSFGFSRQSNKERGHLSSVSTFEFS